MKDTVVLLNFLPAINSSYNNAGCIYPSNAILLIGSYLSKNGFNVKIIDGAFYPDYLERLETTIAKLGERILYVGMSVMVTQIPYGLVASKLVKSISRIPVVWGGPHPTLHPKETLEDPNLDVVVINEGTFTSLELAKAFQAGSNLNMVKGIGFKGPDREIIITEGSGLEDIKKLPFYDFSQIEVDRYLNPRTSSVYKREFPYFDGQLKIMPILTGLGCAYKCQFCINVILKRFYRFRSAREIVDEIKQLKEKFDANTFIFFDEDFFINQKRIMELISICEKEKIHFNFRAWCRVDHFKESYLNEETLRRISEIGHCSLVMGGESGNAKMLAEMQKDITPEQILNSLKTITAASKKIFPRYSFMVGLENETIEEIKKTYRFCKGLLKINNRVDIAGPFLFRLYPGSPIFNRLVERYKIELPCSLEAWSKQISEIGTDDMKWAPIELRKNQDQIEFYSLFAFNQDYKQLNFGVRKIVKFVLAVLSQFRLLNLVFIFPFEFWSFKFYQKIRKFVF